MPYHVHETPLGFAFTLIGQEIGAYYGTICCCLMMMTFCSFMHYIVAFMDDVCQSFARTDLYIINYENLAKFHTKITHSILFYYWTIEY